MNFNDKLHRMIGTVFGIGYLPAPGTMASIVAVLIWFLIKPNFSLSLILIISFLLVGIYVSEKLEKQLGKDPSIVVIDEIVGMFIALFMIKLNFITIFFAFSLFRLFDIFKPLGIRQMERLKGGFGIMFDDVIAGIYTLIILNLFRIGLGT